MWDSWQQLKQIISAGGDFDFEKKTLNLHMTDLKHYL